MSENIGYHTRAYLDHTRKLVGGSFGGSVSMETVNRLTRLFTVTVKPSGRCVFVDREGRECTLYITVDADKTDIGKAAIARWRVEQAAEAERAERQREREAEELATAMAGLSHEEILARLLNPKEST